MHNLFNNTFGVIDKIGLDIAKIARVVEVLIQLFFLAYYSYNVWLRESLALYIIYLVLLVLYSLYFILYIITFFIKGTYETAIRKKTHRYLKDFTILVRLSTIGLSIYSLAVGEARDIDRIFLIAAIIALLLQLLWRLFQIAFEKYSEMLEVSITMDVEAIKEKPVVKAAESLSSPGRTFFHLANKALSKIDDLANGPSVVVEAVEPDPDRELKEEIKELASKAKEKREAKQEIRKTVRKESKAARFQAEKSKNKELFAKIFPKKKKQNHENIKAEGKEIEPRKE